MKKLAQLGSGYRTLAYSLALAALGALAYLQDANIPGEWLAPIGLATAILRVLTTSPVFEPGDPPE